MSALSVNLSYIIIFILFIAHGILLYKYKKAVDKNKLNDITNSLLKLNINKKEIENDVKNTSISDLIKSRESPDSSGGRS